MESDRFVYITLAIVAGSFSLIAGYVLLMLAGYSPHKSRFFKNLLDAVGKLIGVVIVVLVVLFVVLLPVGLIYQWMETNNISLQNMFVLVCIGGPALIIFITFLIGQTVGRAQHYESKYMAYNNRQDSDQDRRY